MLGNLRQYQPRNTLRVVFDTNVFRQGAFDLLVDGPMLRLCKAGVITPIYGHVFLEETLRAYGNEAKRKDLVTRWLPFVFETADLICNDLNVLWHQELVEGRGSKVQIYLPPRDHHRIANGFSRIPLDGTWKAWVNTQSEREEEDKKRAAQKDLNKEMRKTVADWRKAVRYHPKRHGTFTMEKYFEGEVDGMGREMIFGRIPCSDPRAVYTRWSRAKGECLFFTACMISLLYLAQYAMTRHDKKIDLNAQADLFLMTHLLHSDVLVSDETGFLRDAFNDLWRPGGRVLMTSKEFSSFLQKL